MRNLAIALLCLASAAHAGRVERTCRHVAIAQCRIGTASASLACPTGRTVEGNVGLHHTLHVRADVNPCASTIALTITVAAGADTRMCGFTVQQPGAAPPDWATGVPCAPGELPPPRTDGYFSYCYEHSRLNADGCYVVGSGVTVIERNFPAWFDLNGAFLIGIEHEGLPIPPAP